MEISHQLLTQSHLSFFITCNLSDVRWCMWAWLCKCLTHSCRKIQNRLKDIYCFKINLTLFYLYNIQYVHPIYLKSPGCHVLSMYCITCKFHDINSKIVRIRSIEKKWQKRVTSCFCEKVACIWAYHTSTTPSCGGPLRAQICMCILWFYEQRLTN